MRNLQRSTTGLALAATRSSEPATATTGISVARAKMIAFGVSAGGAVVLEAARVRTTDLGEVIEAVVVAIAHHTTRGVDLHAPFAEHGTIGRSRLEDDDGSVIRIFLRTLQPA